MTVRALVHGAHELDHLPIPGRVQALARRLPGRKAVQEVSAKDGKYIKLSLKGPFYLYDMEIQNALQKA